MVEGKEVMKVRTSRKSYFLIYVMIFILVIAMVVIKIYGEDVNKFLFQAVLIFSGILIIFIEVHRLSIFFEVTSISLVHSKGIIAKTTRKVDLSSISDVDSKQSVWQRILGYGDVDVRMFSRDSTLKIKNINNPKKFANFLDKKMNEKRSQSSGGGMGR